MLKYCAQGFCTICVHCLKFASNKIQVSYKKRKVLRYNRLIFSLLLFITIPIFGFSQLQTPFHLQWKTIETRDFRLIFPKEITAEAQKTANYLNHIIKPVAKSLDTLPRKISIVLQNQGVEANGLVTLFPRYSLWYCTPSQDVSLLGSDDWLQSLATHEYRHVVQFAKTNQGFSKIAQYFYGNLGRAAMAWSIPFWVAEGDAIISETVLGNSGRGRIPTFEMPIRSLLLSGKKYNYAKASLNSFKDYYPNHYHLGYLLNTYARRKYGEKVLSKVIDYSSKIAFYPYAFSHAFKKITGENLSEVYQSCMQELDSIWREQTDCISLTNRELVKVQASKSYTNYTQAQPLNDSLLVVKKQGFNHRKQLILLKQTGEEYPLKKFAGNYISVAGTQVVWASKAQHFRWAAKEYSNIFVYHVFTKKTKQLTKKAKLFAPALSADGKKIAAVEYTEKMACSLILLDSQTGEILEKIPSPNNAFIRTPAWSPDGNLLVFTMNYDSKLALVSYDFRKKKFSYLIDYQTDIISKPHFYKKFVLFNSSYSGIANIYAIDRFSKQQFQVVSSRFGASNPSSLKNSQVLYYQEYTIDGYRIATVKIEPKSWKKLADVAKKPSLYFQPLLKQEKIQEFRKKKIPKQEFKIQPYSNTGNLMDIYAWGIVPDLPDINFNIYSKNKLGSSGILAGIGYDLNEKSTKFHAGIDYAALFPVFNISVLAKNRRTQYYDEKNKLQSIEWYETAWNFGVKIPITLSKRSYYSRLTLGTKINLLSLSNKSFTGNRRITEGITQFLNYNLNYYRLSSRTRRDIYSPFGFVFTGSFWHLPNSAKYRGKQASAAGRIYLPGLFKHHHLLLNAGAEWQDEARDYTFSSRLLFPRGYEAVAYSQFYQLSLEYVFPLAYPDFGIGNLIYFKRVQAGFFYDWGIGYSKLYQSDYQTVGCSLSVDFHPFNIGTMLNMGVQFTYRILDGKTEFQPLFFSYYF